MGPGLGPGRVRQGLEGEGGRGAPPAPRVGPGLSEQGDGVLQVSVELGLRSWGGREGETERERE